jgi:hypothetical protein
MVPGGGVEPPWPQGPADFESAASASSAIPAKGGGNASIAQQLCQVPPFRRRLASVTHGVPFRREHGHLL